MRAIWMRVRRVAGSANNTAPSGLLPNCANRLAPPARLVAGIRVLANTSACVSHINSTSLMMAASLRRVPSKHASVFSDCPHPWCSRRTENCPWQNAIRRLVREPVSLSQGYMASGTPVGRCTVKSDQEGSSEVFCCAINIQPRPRSRTIRITADIFLSFRMMAARCRRPLTDTTKNRLELKPSFSSVRTSSIFEPASAIAAAMDANSPRLLPTSTLKAAENSPST